MANTAKNSTNPLVIDATGYTPYAMKRAAQAAKEKAKQTKAARDASAIQDFWMKEHFYEGICQYLRSHEKDLFRSRWECKADQKGLYSRIKWEMDKVEDQLQLDLEQRRLRLKELLENEREQNIEESNPKSVTLEDKHALMLQRYQAIISAKEAKRQQLVNDKKEQQFRLNCDELRAKSSKKLNHMVALDQQVAMERKSQMSQQKELEDKIYAEAWLKDAEAKSLKEEEDERRRQKRNMEYANYLKQQISGCDNPKYDILAEKHERQLMDEQNRLMEVEKDWEKMEKRWKQSEVKKDLQQGIKDKVERAMKDKQDNEMLERRILDGIPSEDVEKLKVAERKRALRKEQEEFQACLSQQNQIRVEKEKILDAKFQEENDKMWEKMESRWKAERKMHEALIKKLHENNQSQHPDKIERMKVNYDEEVAKQAEEDERKVLEEGKRTKLKNLQYQKELLEQIKSKEKQAQDIAEQKKKEFDELKKAREELDRKIAAIVSDAKMDNMHPLRKRPDPYCCSTTTTTKFQ